MVYFLSDVGAVEKKCAQVSFALINNMKRSCLTRARVTTSVYDRIR